MGATPSTTCRDVNLEEAPDDPDPDPDPAPALDSGQDPCDHPDEGAGGSEGGAEAEAEMEVVVDLASAAIATGGGGALGGGALGAGLRAAVLSFPAPDRARSGIIRQLSVSALRASTTRPRKKIVRRPGVL